MDQKRKRQLLFLGILFLLILAAFAALKIYKSNAHETSEMDTESYVVMKIDPSQVEEIGMINGTESINLLRSEDGWKCMEDESVKIDSDAVEHFLDLASDITSDIRIEKVDDLSQYGIDQPQINVTFQWDDNMYTLRLGDFNPVINRYYININDEKTVYTADTSLYYGLNKTLDDFKQLEDAG
ncbi:MAG: DUF4340 domain-containing protein [Lachnospiraceae bacterium]|nr:DUF4340 domain-containing protein [Lachnospiraceae bacterium]